MKISGRYAPGLYLSVIGFGLLILVNAFSIPQDIKEVSQKEKIRRDAELEKVRFKQNVEVERERARLQKQRADAYAENEVLQVSSFAIWGYINNPETPPAIDMRAFADPKQRVYIYDAVNQCVGYVENGAFYWRHTPNNEYICNDRGG